MLRARVQQVLDHFAPWLIIESAWRSSQRQKELYDCWLAHTPGCNPANPPGTSNHEAIPWSTPRAEAVDFRILDGALFGWPTVHAFAATVGLIFPIASEDWHAQMRETPSGSFTGDPFPQATDRRQEDHVGAYPGESIHPTERKTFGILEPGSVIPDGEHIADPVLIHIPFDAYDDPAHPKPGKFRWAIVDKSGKWVDGGPDVQDLHTGGFEILAHPGAFGLTVENKMDAADGRIIGPPLFKWSYAAVAGTMADIAVEPASGTAPAGATLGAEPVEPAEATPDTPVAGDESASG